MATKIVQVHKYFIPPIKEFTRKYYFLVSSLFFEFNSEGYHNRDDVEVYGFNKVEMETMINYLPDFYIEENCLKIEDFSFNILQNLASMLPLEWKKFLIDHMILSSIDKSDNIKDVFVNLKNEIISEKNVGLPLDEIENKDFVEFFKGEDSSFINEYYSKEEQDELRLHYGIGR